MLHGSSSSSQEEEDSEFAVTNPKTKIHLYGFFNKSTCGYCKKSNRSRPFGFNSIRMTVEDYQDLIDRGWRRSGCFIYKNDFSVCCCPYYTIRCRATEFVFNKKCKKATKQVRNLIMGQGNTQSDGQNVAREKQDKPGFNLSLAESFDFNISPNTQNKLEVKLEPAKFSKEKFEVYSAYQQGIHKEPKKDINECNFSSFLCSNPFLEESFPVDTKNHYGISKYGAYHQEYYLNDKLIAVGVIDILPKCISSVYFFYDPEYSKYSLGTYSILREIALTNNLSKLLPDLKFYYLGYYIPNCIKMKYKGQFQPSELLDVIQNVWVPIEKCEQMMKQAPHFTSFLPDPVTGKIIRRVNLEDKLDFYPGFGDMNLDPAALEKIDNKLILFDNRVINAHFLYEYVISLQDSLKYLYGGIGPRKFEEISISI